MTFSTTASPAAKITAPNSPHPDVSFVYVTFGTSSALLDESLRALLASCVADDIDAEIIVVDNAHPAHGHRTGHHVALTTSGVRLALPDDNLGFGGGNDLGIGAARADIICLINPDVIVDSGWLPPLLDVLAANESDIVAPRLVDRAGQLDEAGQFVGPDGHTAPLRDPSSRPPDYASAACWLMQASTYERLGGFEPAFHPAYFEDVDFTFRLRRLGATTRIHPAVAVTHLRGSSVGSGDRRPDVSRQLDLFCELWSSELWRQPPLRR